MSQSVKACGDENFTIPSSQFEITKPSISIEMPYCKLNEINSKHFLKKFHKFIKDTQREKSP